MYLLCETCLDEITLYADEVINLYLTVLGLEFTNRSAVFPTEGNEKNPDIQKIISILEKDGYIYTAEISAEFLVIRPRMTLDEESDDKMICRNCDLHIEENVT